MAAAQLELWRVLFHLPIPGRRRRIVSLFFPMFSNWQGVPSEDQPNYPWTQFFR